MTSDPEVIVVNSVYTNYAPLGVLLLGCECNRDISTVMLCFVPGLLASRHIKM
jgi:hypothetical protein